MFGIESGNMFGSQDTIYEHIFSAKNGKTNGCLPTSYK